MIPDELEEKIVNKLKEVYRDNLQLVVLFGSVATGHSHSFSDIDIAVQIIQKEDYTKDILEIAAIFDSPEYPMIDVILLNVAPIGIKFRVVRDGKVLFESDDRVWPNLKEFVFQRYPDWKMFYDKFQKMYLEG